MLIFLPQSPGYLFLLLGSVCSVLGSRRRRAGDSGPMDTAGDKILIFKSCGTDTFRYMYILHFGDAGYW